MIQLEIQKEVIVVHRLPKEDEITDVHTLAKIALTQDDLEVKVLQNLEMAVQIPTSQKAATFVANLPGMEKVGVLVEVKIRQSPQDQHGPGEHRRNLIVEMLQD